MIKIDHIAVVVEDLNTALSFWQDALGLVCESQQEVAEEAVEIAMLTVGDSHIELVQPTTDDSGIARYLEKRGQGMHHVCLQVPDIHASLNHLAASGVELINDTPRTRDNGTQYAFVHPRSTGGVLVELYQKP
jgi:methylmalonyl-CoA/ethylmalonyl-CoA epimerase